MTASQLNFSPQLSLNALLTHAWQGPSCCSIIYIVYWNVLLELLQHWSVVSITQRITIL